MKIKIGSRLLELRLPLAVYNLPDKATVGVTNRTLDGYFVVFADYDSCERDVVVDDARFLQQHYDEGTMLLLCSSNEEQMTSGKMVGNYHLVGFTKKLFPTVKEIIGLLRCDLHFKVGYRYQQRCHVLRIGQKLDDNGSEIKPRPKLCSILKSATPLQANLGMIGLYEKLYNIKLKAHFSRMDDIKGCELINYVT